MRQLVAKESSLILLSAAVLILSTLDGFLTAHLIRIGLREGNPIMSLALQWGEIPFFFVKTTIVTGVVLICIWLFRKRSKAAYILLIIATTIYLCANVLHMHIIFNILQV